MLRLVQHASDGAALRHSDRADTSDERFQYAGISYLYRLYETPKCGLAEVRYVKVLCVNGSHVLVPVEIQEKYYQGDSLPRTTY